MIAVLVKNLSDNKEDKEKIRRHCFRRIFIGLFMLTSGIAIWVNIAVNNLAESLNPDWFGTVVRVIVYSILIIWISAGFWLVLYGWFSPCPQPLEY